MMETRRRGAAWSIWDLHIHTPSSLVQNYGADDDVTWERFITELEQLPQDIRVIGINDYWFLDGYKRVLREKANGRLANLDAIFPVLEMRLDQFGGTDGNLKRVNMHVIFDPDIDPLLIEQQFLGSLNAQFNLDSNSHRASWGGVVTRESMEALGRQIKAGVPDDELPRFGSDLAEGFNNLNVPFGAVQAALSSSFLAGKALLGLGKTEWAAIKWNEQSIASKKTVITAAHFLFTAFEDAGDWSTQVETLRAAGVNYRLLDCSDAHTWSSAPEKDRLGACSTWMNTTPTFAGLLHALDEFDQRVFVGLEPAALGRLRTSPEQYIDSVKISSRDPSKFPAFNYELPLNSGFVAIVGNKGQGKSALLDCIAVAGNSSRNNEFAFLNPQRFLSTSNKAAREYSSALKWHTGTVRSVSLSSKHDGAAPVAVEYLPQKYVERVCTTDPLSSESHEFEDELREVLFTHIPEEDKAGEASFDALVASKTEEAREQVARLRGMLRRQAKMYSDLSDFIDANVLDEINQKIALKQGEIATAEEDLNKSREALAALDLSTVDDNEVENLRAESEEIREKIVRSNEARVSLQSALGASTKRSANGETLLRRALNLRDQADVLNGEAADLFQVEAMGDRSAFITVDVAEVIFATWRATEEVRAAENRRRIAELLLLIHDFENRSTEIANSLAAVDSTRELARQRVLQGEERLLVLSGTRDQEGSLEFLKHLLDRASQAPKERDECLTTLFALSREAHSALLGELAAVVDLYAPASRFIAKSDVVTKAGLEFKAELAFTSGLQQLSAHVDGRRSSDLGIWIAEMSQRVTPMSWAELEDELLVALKRLSTEKGEDAGKPRHAGLGLRSTTNLEDFITLLLGLSWLEVRFGLIGDGLPLAQLSPGQRGLVLALFYLIVDRRTSPLLLDQPEENLDNATIASLLVPAIREAAGRRQTIIVTHNANLAVVGDADQIVHATVHDRIFSVTSGCISELDVARSAIDILEGTKPAFDNRRHKYEAFPSLASGL